MELHQPQRSKNHAVASCEEKGYDEREPKKETSWGKKPQTQKTSWTHLHLSLRIRLASIRKSLRSEDPLSTSGRSFFTATIRLTPPPGGQRLQARKEERDVYDRDQEMRG